MGLWVCHYPIWCHHICQGVPIPVLGGTLGLSPSPFGATTSDRGSPSRCWVALWVCHHPLMSHPHLVSPHLTGVPHPGVGWHFGFVTIPFGATTSDRGSPLQWWVALWVCHHPLMSHPHLVPPHLTVVPHPSVGWHFGSLGLSPSHLVPPHLTGGPPSRCWVSLWVCHHPLTSSASPWICSPPWAVPLLCSW